MKLRVYIALAVLFTLTDSGYSLLCYSCQSPDGHLYSPDQCEQNEVSETCIDGNYTCGNYRAKTTESNVTTEVQRKGCLLKDDCFGVSQQCNEIVANGGECDNLCCQKDFCNVDRMCYHCDGPFPNGSLEFWNSSSALNQSYTESQCSSEQREVSCLNGKCGKSFYKRFVNEDDVQVELYLRSCFSSSEECTKVKVFCHNITSVENNTAICLTSCCDTYLCNTASRGDVRLLFIALKIMFAMFLL